MHLPRPVLFGALAVIALITWRLAERGSGEEPRQVVTPGHVPEQFATNLRTTETDALGRLARSLQTPRLVRFLDDQSSEAESPVLTVFKEGGPPWVVRAERAWLSADGDAAFLMGKVHITRDAAPGIRPIVIDTTNLHVRPRDDYLETAELATLVSQGSRASGVGAQAWLGKENRIRLLSKARGHYEVDAPK